MLNWDILNFRDILTVGIIAIIAIFIFQKFSTKEAN